MASAEAVNGKMSLLHEHLVLVDKRVTKQEDASSELSKKYTEKFERIDGQISRVQRYQDEDHKAIKELSRQVRDLTIVVSTLQKRISELEAAPVSYKKTNGKVNLHPATNVHDGNGSTNNGTNKNYRSASKRQKYGNDRVAQLEQWRIGQLGVDRIAHLGAKRAMELENQRSAQAGIQRINELGIKRAAELQAEREATSAEAEDPGYRPSPGDSQQQLQHAISTETSGDQSVDGDDNDPGVNGASNGDRRKSATDDRSVAEVVGEKRKLSSPSPPPGFTSLTDVVTPVTRTAPSAAADATDDKTESDGSHGEGAAGDRRIDVGGVRESGNGGALQVLSPAARVVGMPMSALSALPPPPPDRLDRKLSRRAWGANFIHSLFIRMDGDADRDLSKLNTHEAMLYEVTQDNPRLYRRKIQALFAHPAFREAVGFIQQKKDGKHIDAEGVRSMFSKLVEDIRAAKETRFGYGGNHYDCYFYR